MSKVRIPKYGMVVVLVLTSLVIMSGCKTAFDFKYSPLTSVNTLCMEDCSKLVVVSFVDDRENKKAGGIKNLYGMTISEIVLEDTDITGAFSSAVTDTLKKAGYRVAMNTERTTGEDIPSEELSQFDYVVGGRVKSVSVNTKPGWTNVNAEASVVIDLYLDKIANDEKGEWVGPIEGSSLNQSYSFSSDLSGSAEKALNMAIQDSMVNLVAHLKSTNLLGN